LVILLLLRKPLGNLPSLERDWRRNTREFQQNILSPAFQQGAKERTTGNTTRAVHPKNPDNLSSLKPGFDRNDQDGWPGKCRHPFFHRKEPGKNGWPEEP
jgi:hypothetical protein